MKNTHTPVKNRYRMLRRLRAAIQLAAFIFIPGLFISVFSSIRDTAGAVAAGTFDISGHEGTVLLLFAVFAVTLIWGRYFCGFICAFGAIQDFMWFIGEKISKRVPFLDSFRKKQVSSRLTEKHDRAFKKIKYFVLILLLAYSICTAAGWTGSSALSAGETTWSPWTVFGMYASPFRGFAPVKYLFSPGGALLLIILLGSMMTERFFCRYLCPLGAVFAIISRFRLTGITKPVNKCGSCRLCTAKCSMAIPLYEHDRVKSGECINCMKCAALCPKGNAAADPVQTAAGTLTAAMVAGAVFTGAFSADGVLHRDTDPQLTVGAADIQANIAETSKSVTSENASSETSAEGRSAATNDLKAANMSDTSEASAESKKPNESNESKESNTSVETASSPSGKYEDGVYKGTGEGFRGETQVTVTVADGNITDITVDYGADDRQFLERAGNEIINNILSTQSMDVDIVSGATFSSKGILGAVNNALEGHLLQQSDEDIVPEKSISENSSQENSSQENSSGSGTDSETQTSKALTDEEAAVQAAGRNINETTSDGIREETNEGNIGTKEINNEKAGIEGTGNKETCKNETCKNEAGKKGMGKKGLGKKGLGKCLQKNTGKRTRKRQHANE